MSNKPSSDGSQEPGARYVKMADFEEPLFLTGFALERAANSPSTLLTKTGWYAEKCRENQPIQPI